MKIKEQLKRIASRFPLSIQNSMKRAVFARQIRRGNFVTDEKEFGRLSEWVSAGDWVIDIGANIGHYTLKLSSIVGAEGRVLAFEPITATFEVLASNVARSRASNVTLFNTAASDGTTVVGMDIPSFDSGMDNYYMANISADGGISCLTVAVDSLNLPNRVGFIKIDAEGHEMHVLAGMRELLMRDKPILVVELSSDDIEGFLESLGYEVSKIEGSSNLIFTPKS
jgi:FkbM family methyltransferase